MKEDLIIFMPLFLTEEELKRLHASIEGGNTFNQVGFNYDTSNEGIKDIKPSDQPEPDETVKNVEEEKPFMAHPSLAIPPHMEIVSWSFCWICFYNFPAVGPIHNQHHLT